MWPFGGRFFPGTNLQDLNLDWIVQRVRDLSRGIIAPFINSVNQHWMVWDTDAETFVDSGVSAAGEGTGPQGEPGKSPIIGSNGNWYTWDQTTQAYTDTGIAAQGPEGPEGPDGSPGLKNEMLALVVTGDRINSAAANGQYVAVVNSTISGVVDGMYKAAKAIPVNTALDNTYFAAIQNGALNDLQTVSQYSLSIAQDVPGITLVRHHVTKYGKVVTMSLIFRFTADFPTGSATTIIRLPDEIIPAIAYEGTALVTEAFKPLLFNIATSGNLELTVTEAFSAQQTGRLSASYITN